LSLSSGLRATAHIAVALVDAKSQVHGVGRLADAVGRRDVRELTIGSTVMSSRAAVAESQGALSPWAFACSLPTRRQAVRRCSPLFPTLHQKSPYLPHPQ
jgi:hypothetical protein